MEPEEIKKLKDEVEARFYDKMIEIMLIEKEYDTLDSFFKMKILNLVIKRGKLANKFTC